MDFDNLSASFDRLVSHMESEGYAEGYIRRIRTEFNWIESHKEGNSWRTYEDVFRERSGETSSESTARNMGNALAMIARFDLDGILPDRTKRSNPVAPKGAYHLLNEGYRKIIDGYREEAEASGKKASTVYEITPVLLTPNYAASAAFSASLAIFSSNSTGLMKPRAECMRSLL